MNQPLSKDLIKASEQAVVGSTNNTNNNSCLFEAFRQLQFTHAFYAPKHMRYRNYSIIPKKKTWKKFFRSICWHQTPQKPDYLFVKADCKHPDIKKKHFGCPSCPAHLNLLNALKDHFINDYPGSMLHAFQQESNVIPPRSSNKRSAEDTVDIEEADFKLMNPSGLSTVPPCYDDRLIIDGFDVMD
ncbi:hypothetical protein J3Q64DRAFT_1874850 [Phycomyces blakesleeanus]|uniref:C2H2-type zinc finger transcription factor n=2 Tax=Phycomyces blakesleeanus TaxID=4837 RepID=A0A167R0P0_PHYB8|nr:hypothetical protein PHYBLDRAFT_161210 [Phycomyces blakesleeanus NRRL 1555(-)]OAD80569.1 hypothetical protein PHYBLDRAFT_161210 [Phycomyces blakesleeanus NRRL 1555(-)]|eukprot:XP_018298609.1 hypothetical protein PHYBLDRAFT_161210 [Phycomyces blakesleeanus NRRL 1555(-)]